MTNQVIRIDIFISSPADLSEERDIVHRVIEKLNRSPLRESYFLVPLRFEADVPPVVGNEPQLTVDRYISVQKAHILVAMFWSRMGTPFTIPETGEQFDSGTHYEFLKGHEHYQKNGYPHVLLYRKQKENRVSDPLQVEKVEAFFDQFVGEQSELRGLFTPYDETAEFEDLITNHIWTIISKYPPEKVEEKLVTPPDFQEEERRLDAAMPNQVSLGESTEVRVMVCLPESEGLRSYLPHSSDDPQEIVKDDTREGGLSIAFPRDRKSGELQDTIVTVEIDTSDFEYNSPQTIQLTPKHDSGLLVFRLNPLRNRKRSIVIVRVKTKGLDGTEFSCGSTSLCIEISASKLQKLSQAVWKVVSLPLGATPKSAVFSAMSLAKQATASLNNGDHKTALQLLYQQEQIWLKIGNKTGLTESLNQQASILWSTGNDNDTMAVLRKIEGICRQHDDPNRLADALGNQAKVLISREEPSAALALLKEQEQICLESNYKEGLLDSFINQHVILNAGHSADDLLELLEKMEYLCREMERAKLLTQCLIIRANLLANRYHRYQDALPLAEESYYLSTKFGFNALSKEIKPHLETIRANAQT